MKTFLYRLWKNHKDIVIFLLLMVGFRSAIADWNVVPTGSMIPTIVPGDRIWVNKLAYDAKIPFTQISLYQFGDPKRGDIIVFNSKKAGVRLIKRVIGLPGDRVEMINNQLVVNGKTALYKPIDMPGNDSGAIYSDEIIDGLTHATRFTPLHTSPLSNFETITIPEGYYLALGDNRDNSLDSRYYGLIPREEIIGRSQHVVLSLNYDNYYLPRSDRFFYKMK